MRLYCFFIYALGAISRLLGVKFGGKENMPKEGAVVLIANHRHWSDIVLVALAAWPRQVHFMAKSEYGENRLLNWLIYHLGSFTVERGEADIKAIKTALKYLKKGEVVGIFPEGTRNRGDELLPFKEGAFMLAHRAKAQVVPLALGNAERYVGISKPRPTADMGQAYALDGFLNEAGKLDDKAAAKFAHDGLEKLLNSKKNN